MARFGSETGKNIDDILFTNDVPIYYIHCYPDDEIKPIDTNKKDDSFRGGSRGKGGKTKYRRQ